MNDTDFSQVLRLVIKVKYAKNQCDTNIQISQIVARMSSLWLFSTNRQTITQSISNLLSNHYALF